MIHIKDSGKRSSPQDHLVSFDGVLFLYQHGPNIRYIWVSARSMAVHRGRFEPSLLADQLR